MNSLITFASSKNFLKIIFLILSLAGCTVLSKDARVIPYTPNYDQIIMLDAEDLTEQGMGEAYKKLLPMLSRYVSTPATVEEIIDNNLPRYAVLFQSKELIVYSPELNLSEVEMWLRATHYFFYIVNSQLKNSKVKFYAFYAGNDLGGMFMTQKEYELTRQSITKKFYRPYFPTLVKPNYGLEI